MSWPQAPFHPHMAMWSNYDWNYTHEEEGNKNLPPHSKKARMHVHNVSEETPVPSVSVEKLDPPRLGCNLGMLSAYAETYAQ